VGERGEKCSLRKGKGLREDKKEFCQPGRSAKQREKETSNIRKREVYWNIKRGSSDAPRGRRGHSRIPRLARRGLHQLRQKETLSSGEKSLTNSVRTERGSRERFGLAYYA